MLSYNSVTDRRKVIFCPLNDTNSSFSFFILKLILEIKSLAFNNYNCIPPRKFSMYLYPESTSIVKL